MSERARPAVPSVDLRGGPFDGERVSDCGLYCYVSGSARRDTGSVPIVRVHKATPRQQIGVTEQHLYRKRFSVSESWYGWLMELDTDAA